MKGSSPDEKSPSNTEEDDDGQLPQVIKTNAGNAEALSLYLSIN